MLPSRLWAVIGKLNFVALLVVLSCIWVGGIDVKTAFTYWCLVVIGVLAGVLSTHKTRSKG
ncbi:hypothetical protein [Vibrio splendidus]|uniref:Uncharacterized protein n=1 Tax=Vibrio splendidus TaxID=29497 RepID=A0A2T5EJJ1_VIBSP|nr:hypothetical protein [Vibrio splendidus]OEE71728.1 hypothetical protein A147_12720 [Vibrio splendidus FF-6]PTP20355.1 hypothetical protein CWO36_07440 [Vibrio splendidus]